MAKTDQPLGSIRLAALLLALGLTPACVADIGTGDESAQDVAVTAQALASNFDVMTVNVRIPVDTHVQRTWTARLPRLIKMIRANGPEIIGLQELKDWTHKDMVAGLPEYWWFFVDRGDNEMIAIYVNTARFDVLEFDFRGVTNEERNNSCTTDNQDPKNRPIQFVKLRDRQNGRLRYVYNTHYPSKNSCERHGMSNIVADFIESRSDHSADVILIGDLNDGIEADGHVNGSFDRLLDNTGFLNAYAARNPVDSSGRFMTGNGDWNKSARSGKMIDHVLVSTPASQVASSFVDRSMFTTGGTRISCPTVSGGLCPGGQQVNSLELYSDHWAVQARLAP
jgi:endonuclease/exonuclease/phosphatase family metal-dependent hydrolase